MRRHPPRPQRPAGGPGRGGKPGRPGKPARGGKPAHGARPDAGGRRRDPQARARLVQTKAPVWRPGPNARIIRAEAGDRLGRFLTREGEKRWSGRQIKEWLELGCCRINGRVERFASRELNYGDVVEFTPPATDTEHRFDRRRIIYEGDGIIAYDKPAWLPVTRTDAVKSWSLTDILKAELGAVIPVHRLDADTSGIVLFATVQAVARQLEAMFAEHAIAKEYVALVRGHPPETGERRSYLIQVEARQGTERWKSGRGANAREAATAWKVEEHLGTYGSRVRVLPKTGRYHQIRLHFSEMGHPIYGDLIYGDRRDPIPVHRHLLHAAQVSFTHPVTGVAVVIRCRTPTEFADAERALRTL
jgi:RluA family pseudouridine synthase